MAVDVGTPDTEIQLTAASPSFSFTYAYGTGTQRIVLIEGVVGGAGGSAGTIGAPDTLALTYDDLDMAVKAAYHPFSTAQEAVIAFVAAVALPDDYAGSGTILLTAGGSGDMGLSAQMQTLTGARAADAALDTQFASHTIYSQNADAEGAVTPESLGDLVVAVLVYGNGAYQPDTFTPGTYDNIGPTVFSGAGDTHSIELFTENAVTAAQELVAPSTGGGAGGDLTLFTFLIRQPGSSSGGGGGPADGAGYNYNCTCSDNSTFETLLQLRTRMMYRLGFGVMAASPPPGMAATVDEFLKSQNRLMYQKYPALRTRRFFKWTLEEGVRFYGIRENDQDADCLKYFDVTKPIEGVYLRDLNGAWIPLGAGIPPTWYTTVAQNGLPARYEIRSCIEIFPAPSGADYELWVKAGQTPDAFTADGDTPTVESELVFLQALADAKAHYGHPDAQSVKATAQEYLRDLVGSTHTTKRYVPGAVIASPYPQPIFLPLVP